MGFSVDNKHLVLVRLLFIPVTVSMGCQGACAECEPHSSCPPSHPSPSQVQGKGFEASPKHICACRAPLAQGDPVGWQGQGTHGTHCTRLGSPHHKMICLEVRQLPSPG